jgi:hypothetical protein
LKFVGNWTEIKPLSATTAVSGEAVNSTVVLFADLIPAKRVLATQAFHLEKSFKEMHLTH